MQGRLSPAWGWEEEEEESAASGPERRLIQDLRLVVVDPSTGRSVLERPAVPAAALVEAGAVGAVPSHPGLPEVPPRR